MQIFLIGVGIQSLIWAYTETDSLRNFPKDKDPVTVGTRVAEHFVQTPHSVYGRRGIAKSITYPDVCTWYGALTFAAQSQNKALVQKLAKRFEPLFGVDARLIPPADHVDNTVFGAIPLELYKQTHNQRYLAMGQPFADQQWKAPADTTLSPTASWFQQQGYSWQTRLWIDDMYMMTLIQAQAYQVTHNRVYIDRAALEMAMYLDSLQRPNGLFYHAPDVPFFWGRGNGWMAAGMAELLRMLPHDNPHYTRIMQGYQTMMGSLLRYQAEDGMWHQLVDDSEAWPETSATGMFTFAMITGVKNGWLDSRRYGTAARRGWLALISWLDEHNDIRNVCEGTNKLNNRQYYLDRKKVTGDLHGQAPVLWCATALLR